MRVDAVADDLLAFAAERLPAAAVPRRIHVVDTIPRSSAGKILRHELRTTLAERPYTTS